MSENEEQEKKMENNTPNADFRENAEFYTPSKKVIYDRFDDFINIVFVKGKQIDWDESIKNGQQLVESEEDFAPLVEEEVYNSIEDEQKNCQIKEGSYYSWVGEEEHINKKKTGKNRWNEAIKSQTNLRYLLDHLTYIWSLGPIMQTTLHTEKKEDSKIFPNDGLWAKGQSTTPKPADFALIVYLIKAWYKETENSAPEQINLNAARKFIEKKCLSLIQTPCAKNWLLHYCNTNDYPPIAVNDRQEKIIDRLGFIIGKEEIKNRLKSKDATGYYTEKMKIIKEIHQKLKSLSPDLKETKGNIFWPKFSSIIGSNTDATDDLSLLNYKKAIVLYGPPGTSKTHSAIELAESLLLEPAFNSSDENETFENRWKKLKETNIHRLQLHPNYSYEDFMWGYAIENGETGPVSSPKKGFFLNLLEKIKADEKKLPYILILDEINRVDLSRLFGELFSAIENRDDNIDLPVYFDGAKANYKICIPSNLYIIGTMNEIDFSLERVDFALRRRFAWIFKGYKEDVLKQMIQKKLELIRDDASNDIKKSDIEEFVEKCTKLNKKIDDPKGDLGPQYEIGHTIFAEIIPIFLGTSSSKFKDVQKILWNISIKPLLEAYFGNVDQKDLKKKIDPYYKEFFGEENVDGEGAES